MGTYTTHYNLFMPSIGEQGWGELVNGNFTTIDTTLNNLNNNIGTLDTEINAVKERVMTLEAGNFETINVGELTVGKVDYSISISPSDTAIALATPNNGSVILLPIIVGTYTGTIAVKAQYSGYNVTVYQSNGTTITSTTVSSTNKTTIPLVPNCRYVYAYDINNSGVVAFYTPIIN